MPVSIHKDLVAETTELEQASPWNWLFEVKLDSTASLRVAQATEAVTYNGNIYYPYPLTHDGLRSSTGDESRSFTVTAHHVDHQLRSLIHEHHGFADKEVIVTLVHSDHLALTPEQGGTVRQELWEVTDPVEMKRRTVAWSLGFVAQYDRSTPHARFSRVQCRHRFAGPVCQFRHDHLSDDDIRKAGLIPSLVRVCDHGFGTKNGCQAHKAFAAALGMDDARWPAIFGGQRRIRNVRQ